MNQRNDASYEADLIQSSNEGSSETASNYEDEAGVFIPNFVEEMVGGDHVLQMKMARAIHAHEQSTRRCFRCNSPDHLIKDCPEKNELGSPQPKGPQQNKSAQDQGKGSRPGPAVSK